MSPDPVGGRHNKSESNNSLRKACPRRPTHGRKLQPQTGFQMEEEEDEQEEEGKEEEDNDEEEEGEEDEEEDEEEDDEEEDDKEEEEEDEEEKEKEEDDVIDFSQILLLNLFLDDLMQNI